MFAKFKVTLAAVLVFGSASAVLADRYDGNAMTQHNTARAQHAAPAVLFEGRNAAVNSGTYLTPGSIEEQRWFDRASSPKND
jgi:hypothetical protein